MVKRMRYAVFLVLAAALSAPAQTVLLHATVIDGIGGAPLPDASIVISDGRIAAIGPAAKIKTPAGAQVIDLTGKTIIPGIINAHSHISDDPAVKLRHFALYGVTSTIGMGGDGDDVLKIRDEQRHGDIKGARAYTVQQRFEFEKDAPTPDIARLKVEELYKQGADVVNVVVDNH